MIRRGNGFQANFVRRFKRHFPAGINTDRAWTGNHQKFGQVVKKKQQKNTPRNGKKNFPHFFQKMKFMFRHDFTCHFR